MTEDAAQRGTRDNGLRCVATAPAADVDPRVADALLSALRDNGIAAYAAPAPTVTGGLMEPRLPDSPADRVWADEEQTARAKQIVSAHAGAPDAAGQPDPAMSTEGNEGAAGQHVAADEDTVADAGEDDIDAA